MRASHSMKFVIRNADELAQEVRRVQTVLADISIKMSNPEQEIGETVRLSVYQRELQAYLQGIQFTLGESELPITR